MKFISLFAGIGGFDLGFERAGMECVAQVEIDPFCQKVLAKHWPDVPRYGDIRDVGKHNLPTAELICGGFPCQPFSNAGKRRGKKDDRYLWPEMLRVVAELKPKWFVGENVPGIINLALDTVLSDLENEGYTCETFIVPACAVNAPHRRDRVWIVGNSENSNNKGGKGEKRWSQTQLRRDGSRENVAYANGERLPFAARREEPGIQQTAGALQGSELGGRDATAGGWWAVEPELGGSPDGFPLWLERHIGGGMSSENWKISGWEDGLSRVSNKIPRRVDRLRALGNAVVPQVVEVIGRSIMDVTNDLP